MSITFAQKFVNYMYTIFFCSILIYTYYGPLKTNIFVVRLNPEIVQNKSNKRKLV